MQHGLDSVRVCVVFWRPTVDQRISWTKDYLPGLEVQALWPEVLQWLKTRARLAGGC
ncbi:hypothetical protein GBAR_LOCUS30078 [Geodia barretti]|uniref:Uncharacterized protein n=1 Tax=Geodia barretti TaxID=519541 RepID=A0AA35TVA9_GEOBA|nr:hypothetical protein GBAR_LOCUS30078 [Geodia barretti]